MDTESQLVNMINHLHVTFSVLNHFTTQTDYRNNVARVNLEYSKKFIYERMETAKKQLEYHRAFNKPATPLQSTLKGGSLTAQQAIQILKEDFC